MLLVRERLLSQHVNNTIDIIDNLIPLLLFIQVHVLKFTCSNDLNSPYSCKVFIFNAHSLSLKHVPGTLDLELRHYPVYQENKTAVLMEINVFLILAQTVHWYMKC